MTSPHAAYKARLETLRRVLDRERRPPTDDERRELYALRVAADRAYVPGPQEVPGALGGMFHVAERPKPSWEELEAEFGPVEPHAEPSRTRRGGAPLEPVMKEANARRLQTVIDRELANGHDPNITKLAESFDVSRSRIRQAMERRKAGHDLFENLLSVTPPELRTVTDSEGNVYWPLLENPSKS